MAEEIFETDKKLTAAQYWEWRCTISDQDKAKLSLDIEQLRYKFLMLEAEHKKLRADFQKENVKSALEKTKAAEKEYGRFKAQLEGELGMSLNNTIIDEITFTVKLIKETNEKK